MDVEELACVVAGVPAHGGDNLERLPIQDANRFIRSVHDIEELLILIRRDGERVYRSFALKRVFRDEDFPDERAIQLEYLKTVVGAVGNVNKIVIGHQHSMHRVVEALRSRPLNHLRARRQFQIVVRLLAISSPVPLVSAGIGIENDDTLVEISIRDEQLIRLAVYE